jgi:hypothetical protein
MMIRDLVACEHEYINTDHPDFIGGTRAVKVGANCTQCAVLGMLPVQMVQRCPSAVRQALALVLEFTDSPC